MHEVQPLKMSDPQKYACVHLSATHATADIPEMVPRKPFFVKLKSKEVSHGACCSSQYFWEGIVHISHLIKSLFCLLYSEAVCFCEIRTYLKSDLSQAPSTFCTSFLARGIDLPSSQYGYWVCCCCCFVLALVCFSLW